MFDFFSYVLVGDNMDEINMIKEQLKRKRKGNYLLKNKKEGTNNKLSMAILKLMILIILFLLVLIYTKSSEQNKVNLYENLFSKNISFATINNLYTKYLGGILPFESFFNNHKPVFNEQLVYNEESIYKDGVKLKVDNKYLVPILEDGIVIFIGEKEDYGKTVIIQQKNGIDIWYGNVDNVNVQLYDYVNKGTLLGETIDEKLYLVYKKEGEILNYKDYL